MRNIKYKKKKLTKKYSQLRNKRRTIIFRTIIIIVLIIIILLLCKYCNHDKKLVPTGNVDIFELDCNLPTCKECEKCPTCSSGENTNPGTNNNPGSSGSGTSSTGEKKTGFDVFDDKITWTTESELRIFTNPAYEFTDIIAPGSGNTYVFRVRNNNSFNVNYKLIVTEENIFNINMKYRLKKDDQYIIGDKNTWVKYEELNISDIVLNAHKYDEYVLEWKWVESANDTEIGTADNAYYKLKMEITGIEI